MSLRVDTKGLVGFLTDLLQTAGDDPDTPYLNGVLVHATRGHWGADPGKVDLLAGVSTNRFVVGHTWTLVRGDLGDGPMWWDRYDILATLAMLKPLAKKPDHAVELRMSAVDPEDGAIHSESTRGFVVVEEDKDLFGDGFSCSFPSRDGSDFPGQTLYRVLATRPDDTWTDRETGAEVDVLRRTDLSSVQLQPFLTVGRRRGNLPIQTYRAHQNRGVHVQIGEAYLGVLMPVRYGYGEDGDVPTCDIYPPDWPDTPGDDDAVDLDAILVPSTDANQTAEKDPAGADEASTEPAP